VGETVPSEIRDAAIEFVEDLIPGMMDAAVVDQWVGVRSVTPDGNPVVGWTDLEGFSVAAFHTSGIQLAPAVGDVLARQLVDGDPTEYYDALSITRFDGYSDVRS
jgi:glycine/D-amino acid oxidase-like deaminating enzyme